MYHPSNWMAYLLKILSLPVFVLLLTHCANVQFPDEVEIIVPGEEISASDWGLSPDGTKLFYSPQYGGDVLIYLETNEKYEIDGADCNRGDPYWLDERLLACGPLAPNLFDTEARQLTRRKVVKRDEVDIDTLLSEAERIYLRPNTLILLDQDPYADDANNYVLGDNMQPNGFGALVSPYPHIVLPIRHPDKVYSPDEVYYYTVTASEEKRGGVPAFYTLTIFTAADDQEVISASTETLRDSGYRIWSAGWAWDSNGVYFSIHRELLNRLNDIRKLNIPQPE